MKLPATRLDYHSAILAPVRPGPLDEIRAYVAAERGKGRTWSQIAKASGRPEPDLRAAFGRVFP